MLERFRDKLFLIALGVSAISLMFLWGVARYQPIPNAVGWRLGQTTYTVLSDAASALLSIGLISLIFELFLRESYARALRKFLELKGALVTSGLVDIKSGAVDLSARIAHATTVRAVVRDPQAWVLAHYSSIVAAAVKRSVDVTLLFPDSESTHFPAVAESLDYSPEELRTSLELALSAIKQRWGTAGTIHAGSKIAVKTVQLPLYELTCIDDFAVCTFDSSVEHRQGGTQYSFSFSGGGHPIDWFESQISSVGDAGELWAGDDRTPAPRRRSSQLQRGDRDAAMVANPYGELGNQGPQADETAGSVAPAQPERGETI